MTTCSAIIVYNLFCSATNVNNTNFEYVDRCSYCIYIFRWRQFQFAVLKFWQLAVLLSFTIYFATQCISIFRNLSFSFYCNNYIFRWRQFQLQFDCLRRYSLYYTTRNYSVFHLNFYIFQRKYQGKLFRT